MYSQYQESGNNRFVSIFRLVALVILLGAVAFSIARNIRGLEAAFPGLSIPFQVLIAGTVTAGAVILAGSAIIKTFTASPALRWCLFAAGLVFSLGNFSLNLAGALEDNRNRYRVNVASEPEIVKLEGDLAEIVRRQNEYGMDQATKEFLLTQETYLRNELSAARDRARVRAENREREEAKGRGSLATGALALFAALPEVSILTFTALILILSNVSIFNNVKAPQQPGASHGQQAGRPSQGAGQPGGNGAPAAIPGQAQQEQGNGLYEPAPEEKGGADRWNPFS